MFATALTFPEFDPVAFQLGPIAIRWYGLAYLAGILLGWQYGRRLIADSPHAAWRRREPPGFVMDSRRDLQNNPAPLTRGRHRPMVP